VCLQQLDVLAETPEDSPVIMLACYHCFHNKVRRWGPLGAAGAPGCLQLSRRCRPLLGC
jgi:hypothetical protein